MTTKQSNFFCFVGKCKTSAAKLKCRETSLTDTPLWPHSNPSGRYINLTQNTVLLENKTKQSEKRNTHSNGIVASHDGVHDKAWPPTIKISLIASSLSLALSRFLLLSKTHHSLCFFFFFFFFFAMTLPIELQQHFKWLLAFSLFHSLQF